MTNPIKDYLAEIGRKGGSVKGKNLGNKHAQKYATDDERKAGRRKSQQAYIARKKLENQGNEPVVKIRKIK